jgi:hypothetical protein
VSGYKSRGTGVNVAVAGNRFYLADYYGGLLVLRSLPNLQLTFPADGQPGVPFTIEATTDLNPPVRWTPIFSTEFATLPFDYVDFDVRIADQPQKFYRARQP